MSGRDFSVGFVEWLEENVPALQEGRIRLVESDLDILRAELDLLGNESDQIAAAQAWVSNRLTVLGSP